ncbi:LysR family transcriptional regulator [Nocardia sp. CA2R105]|uniref:LysR substrate-binding domain-containing protein n=1 Tax=Nocardia coffeae TaxID=2873381 RepID=UPI001CA612CB|nr:LysR family transcriptional regulator [Nocardia coffeae]
MIDVQRLAVFREVASAGSFAGAATALHHTPSAVSQQIAALERSVGVQLVERSTRGVRLTAAGHILLEGAVAVASEVRAVERRLAEFRAEGPSSLTVVAFPSAGEVLLAPALTDLTADAHQPADITVVEAEPDDALAAVRHGEADLALVYHFHTPEPPRNWSDLAGPGEYQHLMSDELRLVVPADHNLAGRSSASITAFAHERWIHAWGEPGSVLDTLAAVHGFRPEVACRSSDYRFMCALVAAGVGIALVPHLALAGIPGTSDLAIDTLPKRFVGIYMPIRPWRHGAAQRLAAALEIRARSLTGSRSRNDS